MNYGTTSSHPYLSQREDCCHGFGWDKAYFLHRDVYDAVFWVFDENNGDNTWMFLVVAKYHFHLVKDFFYLCCPASEGAGGAQEAGRGHRQDS